MELHIARRPNSARQSKALGTNRAALARLRETFGAPAELPARRTALQTSVFWAALVGVALRWFAVFNAAPAAEQRVAMPNRAAPPILVAPGPGGVAISSDDPEALDRFTQLFAALASIRSAAKEEAVVFYLKHAKAAAVAEILEALFRGGPLAEEPPPRLAPFFGGFGPFGTSTRNFAPGGPFGGPGGFGSPFGRGRDTGPPPGRGAAESSEGRSAPAGQQRPAPSTRATSGVRITPDARLNALIVQAGPGDMEIVEELLKILDQQATPEVVAAEPRPRLIPIQHVPVQSVLDVLRQVYQDRLTNATSGANSGAGSRPEQVLGMQGPGGPPGFPQPPGAPGAGPAQFLQQLAMAAGGAGRRGRVAASTEELPKMALGADPRSNALVVVAPDRLFEEVRDLVRQLDRPASGDAEAIQVLALRSGNSELVRRALPAFMGDRVRVGQAAPTLTFNGRRMGSATTAARRQGPSAAGEGLVGPQAPSTGGTGAPATQSPAGSPPSTSPLPASGPPAGVARQDGFGRRGGGALGAGFPSLPNGLNLGGGPGGLPANRDELPPQPPGQIPFPGPPGQGPGEAGPPFDSVPGPNLPPPGPLP